MNFFYFNVYLYLRWGMGVPGVFGVPDGIPTRMGEVGVRIDYLLFLF